MPNFENMHRPDVIKRDEPTDRLNEALSADEKMLAAALNASKIPEFQTDANIIGEVVYHFAFDAKPESFGRWLATKDVADQVDRLLFTTALMRDARASGAWADPFVRTILSALANLQGNIDHPLARRAYEYALERVRGEYENPTGGIVKWTNDRTNARESIKGSKRFYQSSVEILERIKPDNDSYLSNNFSIIARDVVAMLDKSQIAQSFANMGADELRELPPVSRKVRLAQEWVRLMDLERRSGEGRFELDRLDLVFSNLEQCLGTDPKAYAEIFKEFTPERLVELFESRKRINDLQEKIERFESDAYRRAEERNLEASKQVIEEVASLFKKDTHPYRRRATIEQRLYGDDLEMQFDAMEELSQNGEPYLSIVKNVLDFHQKSFVNIPKEVADYVHSLESGEGVREDLQNRNILENYATTPEVFSAVYSLYEALAKGGARKEVRFKRFSDFEHHLQQDGELNDIRGLHVLREFMRPVLREGIEEQMNIDLRELSLREQIELFKYLTQASPEDAEEVFKYAKQYGIPYLQTFLVAERQPEAVATIQALARGEDKENARSIFQAYGEIVLATDEETEVMIREKMKDASAIDSELLRKRVNEELLQKAGAFFQEASRALLNGNVDRLKGIFDDYKKESLLFRGLFKSAFELGGEAVIDKMRGVEFEHKDQSGVTEEERVEIERMIKKNWSLYPKAIQDIVFAGYRKAIEPGSGATFYLLKKDGVVVAVDKFLETEVFGGKFVEFGTMNVDPSLRGSSIGTAFIERTISIENEDKPIYAASFTEDEISSAYVRRFGFVFLGGLVTEDGLVVAKMLRDKTINEERKIEKADRKTFTLDIMKNKDELLHLLARCEHEGLMITKFNLISGSPNLREITIEPLLARVVPKK